MVEALDDRLFLALDISGVERMFTAGMSALVDLQRILSPAAGPATAGLFRAFCMCCVRDPYPNLC